MGYDTNLVWRLHGPGMDHFGLNGNPESLLLRQPGPDELLARVDALGLCFSDLKLINQGGGHPRILGRNLSQEPVVPGHEVSLTIVAVGERLSDAFHVGERYVIQPDMYYKGTNRSYGYAVEGGMQQYCILGDEVLRGDEGCYLIPIRGDIGYAEAALTEPWACVEASYRITTRRTIKSGGVMLIVGPGNGNYAVPQGCTPKRVILAGVGDEIDRSMLVGAEIIEIGTIRGSELLPMAQERTGGRGFDDIIVLGDKPTEIIELLASSLANGGILNLVGCSGSSSRVQVDVGRIHYDRITVTSGNDIVDGYASIRPQSELVPNGRAWFIGAGGPMGQMHVERALSMEHGPRVILATDTDSSRLIELESRTQSVSESLGIKMECIDPSKPDVLETACERLTNGQGFDDIVVLAPSADAIAQASPYLGQNGLMNIFAGVPRLTFASMDVSAVCNRSARWTGASGSRPDDLEYVLRKAERREILVNRSVAAIAGIDAVADGVRAVQNGVFAGKVVIYPQIRNLPLTVLSDIRDTMPEVYAELEDGRFWTKSAEDKLIAIKR